MSVKLRSEIQGNESAPVPLFAVFHDGGCADRAVDRLRNGGTRPLACSVVISDMGARDRDTAEDETLLHWMARRLALGLVAAGATLSVLVQTSQMSELAACAGLTATAAVGLWIFSGFRTMIAQVSRERHPKSVPLFLLTANYSDRSELQAARAILESSGAAAVSWGCIGLAPLRRTRVQPYRPESSTLPSRAYLVS